MLQAKMNPAICLILALCAAVFVTATEGQHIHVYSKEVKKGLLVTSTGYTYTDELYLEDLQHVADGFSDGVCSNLAGKRRLCTVVHNLPAGSISLVAAVGGTKPGGGSLPDIFVVTGGTGDYAGKSGSVVVSRISKGLFLYEYDLV